MAMTNVNVRTDAIVKEKAEKIFEELGLNMSVAINMFLRQAIREKGIPFEVKLKVPNNETVSAIEEGRRIAHDDSIEGYETIEALKKALEI